MYSDPNPNPNPDPEPNHRTPNTDHKPLPLGPTHVPMYQDPKSPTPNPYYPQTPTPEFRIPTSNPQPTNTNLIIPNPDLRKNKKLNYIYLL